VTYAIFDTPAIHDSPASRRTLGHSERKIIRSQKQLRTSRTPPFRSYLACGGGLPARDLAAFEATRRACELLDWEYRLVGAADPIVTANVRWLAWYQHLRHGVTGLAEALRVVFDQPVPLMAGAEAVGDPVAVLPVLFHLLWRQELVTDLSVPLHPWASVTTAVTGVVAV
jgi:hypothetical protein